MCGRYRLKSAPEEYLAINDVRIEPKDIGGILLQPRFNIAPTQPAPIVVRREEKLTLEDFRWGLVPFWAKEVKPSGRNINARSEGVRTNAAFRSAFKARRCLVPADGFYEWRKEGKAKFPQDFHLKHGARPFFFAGLWEEKSLEKDGEKLRTFTILTTSANALVGHIHDRMPVILPPDACLRWMNPETEPDMLEKLLVPLDASEMETVPVSTTVNNANNEGPELLEPQGPVSEG